MLKTTMHVHNVWTSVDRILCAPLSYYVIFVMFIHLFTCPIVPFLHVHFECECYNF